MPAPTNRLLPSTTVLPPLTSSTPVALLPTYVVPVEYGEKWTEPAVTFIVPSVVSPMAV